MPTSDWPELAEDAQSRWNLNAGFWDDYMGEHSNDFHNLLVRPAMDRLLAVEGRGRSAGHCLRERELLAFSRRAGRTGHGDRRKRRDDRKGAETLREGHGTGASENETAGEIDYRVIDVTDTKELEGLGTNCFDAAVSNMAVMDMAEVGPMFGAVHGLLKPGGVFVFSLTHPCFQAPYAVRYAEQVDQDGRMIQKVGIKIDRYLTPQPFEGLAIVGQPVPNLIFHRPLSALLAACFEAGFVLDGLEERAFDESVEADRELSWANFRETPPMMAVRLRRMD